jgi:hypothetical protein
MGKKRAYVIKVAPKYLKIDTTSSPSEIINIRVETTGVFGNLTKASLTEEEYFCSNTITNVTFRACVAISPLWK